jgi:hypothetical protein
MERENEEEGADVPDGGGSVMMTIRGITIRISSTTTAKATAKSA